MGRFLFERYDMGNCCQYSLCILLGGMGWVLTYYLLLSVNISHLLRQTTRSIALSALAAFIGLLTTLIFRQLILLCLRRTLYGAFYRRRPLAANLLNLILECWNLGLTTGYILGRSVKLVMLAIVYMGRIDTPFLADGVGWLFGARQVPLDSYPIAFRKELVSHEAVSAVCARKSQPRV